MYEIRIILFWMVILNNDRKLIFVEIDNVLCVICSVSSLLMVVNGIFSIIISVFLKLLNVLYSSRKIMRIVNGMIIISLFWVIFILLNWLFYLMV